ncbi:MAG: hypothetical protein ACLSV6_07580, partial [Butyricicoccus sp.]
QALTPERYRGERFFVTLQEWKFEYGELRIVVTRKARHKIPSRGWIPSFSIPHYQLLHSL